MPKALLFAARRLLVQLEGLLAARQAGVRGFTLRLLHDDAGLPRRGRPRLAGARCRAPGAAAARAAGAASRWRSRWRRSARGGRFRAAARPQRAACSATPPAEAEGWARLLERLRARLGARGGVRPRHAARPPPRARLAARRAGRMGSARIPRSRARGRCGCSSRRKLREGEFTLLAGPERIESGWWDGDDARRDYFVARLPNASLALGLPRSTANGSCMASLPDYAELHCLSNFSFLRGASHPGGAGGARRTRSATRRSRSPTNARSPAWCARTRRRRSAGCKLILGTEITLEDGLKLVLLATDRRSYGAISCADHHRPAPQQEGPLFA